jgi:glycerol-3-phosphate responsive antiterminator
MSIIAKTLDFTPDFNDAITGIIKKRLEEEVDRVKAQVVAGVLIDVMGMAEMDIAKDRIVFTIRKKD